MVGAPLGNTNGSKYSLAVMDVIVKYLKQGLFRADSARMAGVSAQTLDNWIKKDPIVLERVLKAESDNKASWVKIIAKHAKHSWQAMAWLMERRHNEFSPKLATLQGQGNVQIAIVSGGYQPPSLEDKQPLQRLTGDIEAKQVDTQALPGTNNRV